MSPISSSLVRRGKHLGLVVLGALAALGILSLSRSNPAQAQGPGVNLTTLYNQVQTQQATINALTKNLSAEQTRAQAAEAALLTTINALKTLTSPLSLSGTDFMFTGVNVHIVSGSGSTNDGGSLTGLGNLIIGYNAIGNLFGDHRTGSHNLILGDLNSYSSYGGFVAGQGNTISGAYASVSGGQQNTASGLYNSVSGGQQNTASGIWCSISGGQQNTADGELGSVSGGLGSIASGFASSISGGNFNLASGFASSVSGGYINTASGNYSSVSGGAGDQAIGAFSTVSGGYSNTASGNFSSVSGGEVNVQSNDYGWTGGNYHYSP